jgi:DivIVA domain-containing protein
MSPHPMNPESPTSEGPVGSPSSDSESVLDGDGAMFPESGQELTAQTLRDVQFRQSWKGYDTVEVDDFLDVVAAGVAELRERLAKAQSAAQRNAQAMQHVAHARTESDESVRRTLVLAQRAADLVVSEAKSVADRIVADAHSEAAAITNASRSVADQTELQARSRAEQIEQHARARADQLVSEASAAAERHVAVRAAELQASLEQLVAEQGRKQLELEQLRAQVDGFRAQLRAELEAQMRRLDTVPEPPTALELQLRADGD